jgi:hypothetical protein
MNDIGATRRVASCAEDTVGIVHAAILLIQALLLPI